MHIYVGTLYTIENEYDECVESINSQSYKNFDHYVFKNLPNKEAHNSLFKSFLEKADDYDVLVKIDADMVVISNLLFEQIINKLSSNAWADILSIAVYDYFSNQLIHGLNAFRNTVKWKLDGENLFVDIPDVHPNKYLFDDKELAPAAIHCKNPSPLQAFHYGIHRGLKVVQPSRNVKNESYSRTHWNLLERTWLNFQRTKDTRIGLAALGAELAYSGLFRIRDLDYSNPRIKHNLEKYSSLGFIELNREIRKRRLLNWGILSGRNRRKILCLLYPLSN